MELQAFWLTNTCRLLYDMKQYSGDKVIKCFDLDLNISNPLEIIGLDSFSGISQPINLRNVVLTYTVSDPEIVRKIIKIL